MAIHFGRKQMFSTNDIEPRSNVFTEIRIILFMLHRDVNENIELFVLEALQYITHKQ